MEQTHLFEIKNFQTEEEIAKEERKRGFYKKKQPDIIPLYSDELGKLYTEMKNLYERLASYFDLDIFSREEKIFTYKNIRIWFTVYDEKCEDVFTIPEAEIIGTEDMDIYERLEIHKKLIDLLSDGILLDEALAQMEV